MTITEFSPTTAVVPIIDYEPGPVTARPPGLPRADTTHRRRPREPRRLGPATRTANSARLRHASAFADGALRTVLEVLDRRRPVSQLRPLMDTALIDTVAGLVAVTERNGTAVLRRVLVQAADPGEQAFEVAAGYTRGLRRHAVACRVEARNNGWRLVALQIG